MASSRLLTDLHPCSGQAWISLHRSSQAVQPSGSPPFRPSHQASIQRSAANPLNRYIHNSGFFLTWHRYFLHLFESDLRSICGYRGRFPYWNFGASSSNVSSATTFDGSAFSMSGDGQYLDSGPIALGPNFIIPKGTGGGCVTTGPFANLTVPMKNIPNPYLGNDTLPPDAYAYQPNCLKRDLNTYIASTYTNTSSIIAATRATDAAAFDTALNGVFGGGVLGIHSGAHFEIGGAQGQMSSIFVSVQDPIWFAMHTFVDLVYDSWQRNNPDQADGVSGTMTAGNVPPSEEVTLDSALPDWGYLKPNEDGSIQVGDLLNTTDGPFCYEYDLQIS
jgi:tyrosinase